MKAGGPLVPLSVGFVAAVVGCLAGAWRGFAGWLGVFGLAFLLFMAFAMLAGLG